MMQLLCLYLYDIQYMIVLVFNNKTIIVIIIIIWTTTVYDTCSSFIHRMVFAINSPRKVYDI